VKTSVDTTMLASRLRLVLGHLIRRMRAENRFPLSQGAVLGRLDREGACSIGALAAAERVRPQSMTQTIADMEGDGLISRRPDPTDGRRTFVELTELGLQTLEADRRHREGWIANVIAEDFTAEEQRLLADALVLLERISES
jgi:DNA-binding MarR family transcriptional regulator